MRHAAVDEPDVAVGVEALVLAVAGDPVAGPRLGVDALAGAVLGEVVLDVLALPRASSSTGVCCSMRTRRRLLSGPKFPTT